MKKNAVKLRWSLLLSLLFFYKSFGQLHEQKIDFEQESVQLWEVLKKQVIRVTKNPKSGKYALELSSGALTEIHLKVRPHSQYRLSGWLKTESGSGEVRIKVNGSGGDVSTASALAAWTKVELSFNTGENQSELIVELNNPENYIGNHAWVDDIEIVYIEEYIPSQETMINPNVQRKPVCDLGLSQQPNEKMEWLRDAKFGMFIHWGLYSGVGKGEWFMENSGTLPSDYKKLAYKESGDQYFDAKDFNADNWAGLAKDAGMKYMCMVTMHHDGYALFDSDAMNSFTSVQTHNRDFVKEYVDACRKSGLKVGLYKTLINWRYPGYYDINGTNCNKNKFGYTTDIMHKENATAMKNELYRQVKELMTNYGKIDILFWDGGWLGQQGSDAAGAYFWESGLHSDPENNWPVNPLYKDIDSQTGKPLGIMGLVRKYQPDILVNARSGWMGDFKSEEGGQPVTGPIRSGAVWEKCMTMAPGWGYTPQHEDSLKVISSAGVKRMLADCVVRNMSLLLNVAPDRHGNITAVEQDVLRETGKWLATVGDAVYGTRGGPWDPKDGLYGFTYNANTIYIYLLDGYNEKEFILPGLNNGQKVTKAYVVSDGTAVRYNKNRKGQTVLSGFRKNDPVVTILAVELNTLVLQ